MVAHTTTNLQATHISWRLSYRLTRRLRWPHQTSSLFERIGAEAGRLVVFFQNQKSKKKKRKRKIAVHPNANGTRWCCLCSGARWRQLWKKFFGWLLLSVQSTQCDSTATPAGDRCSLHRWSVACDSSQGHKMSLLHCKIKLPDSLNSQFLCCSVVVVIVWGFVVVLVFFLFKIDYMKDLSESSRENIKKRILIKWVKPNSMRNNTFNFILCVLHI